MSNAFFPHSVFTPQDLDVVGRIHADICKSRGVDPRSPEAEEVARAIFSHFQNGIREAPALHAAIRSNPGRTAV
jgi:hypothetical protein